MNEALRIVVLAPDLVVKDPSDDHAIGQAKRSRSLRIGPLSNGFNLIAALPADVFWTERLAQRQPGMIIVDAESDARDALEHGVIATRDARRPILDVAMARFQHEQALRQELAQAKTELTELSVALKDHKVIDRAKTLLMERQKLTV